MSGPSSRADPPAPPTTPSAEAAPGACAPRELEGLYARFAPVVHGVALAHVGADEADDVVQEVFVKVATRLGSLRDPQALPGWITALARNAARDRLRARARRPRLSDDALHALPARAQAPEDDRRLRLRVLTLLQRLPEAYREALVLRLVEGLGGAEIAARTGLSPGSVRVNLHRGFALLRPLLAAEGW